MFWYFFGPRVCTRPSAYFLIVVDVVLRLKSLETPVVKRCIGPWPQYLSFYRLNSLLSSFQLAFFNLNVVPAYELLTLTAPSTFVIDGFYWWFQV